MSGRFIALIGSDGTGKSSIALHLKERLQKSSSTVSYVYMGASNPLLLTSRILLVLGSLKARRQQGELGNNESDSRRRVSIYGIVREFTFLHYIFELFARYFVWIRPKVRRGEIVVVDRYIYDFLIMLRFLNRYKWFRSFMLKLIPKPDLLVCLYNDPDIIMKRKQDNSRDEIIRQTEIFFSLEHSVNVFKKIKTDGTIEEVSERIIEEAGKII